MKKENQRVKLTKKLLKQSLLDIMDKKPVGSISVIELCEKAEINRSTFYNHYGCPNDVLYDIECDFVEDLCTYLQDNKKLAKLLLKESYTSEFPKLLFKAAHVKNLYENMFSEISDEQGRKLLITFFTSGTYNMLREWLNSPDPLSPEEMGELVKTMSANDFKKFFKGL